MVHVVESLEIIAKLTGNMMVAGLYRPGLARAFELAPQDAGLRFNAAKMFLREGNKAEARAMLAPLAYSPHGRGYARQATNLIAIDKGNSAQLGKAIDEMPAEPDDGDPTASVKTDGAPTPLRSRRA